jgi:hypothetical protein
MPWLLRRNEVVQDVVEDVKGDVVEEPGPATDR